MTKYEYIGKYAGKKKKKKKKKKSPVKPGSS